MSHADQGNDDAARTAEAVLRRGHKHIRRLVVITIGLWIVAALLIPAVYLPLGAKLKQYSEIIKEPAPPAAPLTAQQMGDALTEIQHQQWIVGQLVLHEWIIGAIILGLALAAGILASISTVALALTIRRVTMQRVSASLSEISDQLRLLREQPRGGAAS
jgi:hypothetical protein